MRDVGGIRDTAPNGLGHIFPFDAAAEEVADVIQGYLRAPDEYVALRRRVAARVADFSWDKAVARFISVWHGSRESSYQRTAARETYDQ